MKSETWDVRHVYQGRRLFAVPHYQRAYAWSRADQWEALWEDIKAKAEDRLALDPKQIAPHFLGATVVEQQPRSGLRGVDTFHIIDGQQRLTTLQFVLRGLVVAFNEATISGLVATFEDCMRNGSADTMNRPEVETYKLWPTFRDQANFTHAFACNTFDHLRAAFPACFTQQGHLRAYGAHPPALEAIWYFASRFHEWITEEGDHAQRAEALALAVLEDLRLVMIFLEEADDAQTIFETLNGRGAALNATDLVRNFIFMRAARENTESADLYESKWTPFEQEPWTNIETRGRIKRPRLEWLLYTMLQAEGRAEVDLARLYNQYKAYAAPSGKPPLTAAQQLDTLTKYAAHYQALTSGEGPLPIAHFGRRITPYEASPIHPLALMISTSNRTDAEKTAIFNLLVSFLVRRAVCGLTNKAYANIFMSLMRQLNREEVSVAAVSKHLSGSKSDTTRWPDDAEFQRALTTYALYSGNLDAPKARQILTELEAAWRRGKKTEELVLPNLNNLDIEHIMPRSWYAHWPLTDGAHATKEERDQATVAQLSGLELSDRQQEILKRDAAISTLGNLTLLNLSVNREAQNKSFSEKKTLLIAHSNLSLNTALIALSCWNVEAIQERGMKLTNIAIALYPGSQ
ncbi:DUF262 domain-containing protein [Rhodanobacter hydrolyticus]|uniref:DUF262 domain-containing protein n=1 Tax=Rhodanobacter hydrolyticus TaxID=2250595 RepID=A0ABW8J456_9GAMM